MRLARAVAGLEDTGCRVLEGEGERAEWAALADTVTPFHGPGWERATRVLGHQHFVLGTGTPSLTGVLPLALRASRLFGKSLVAMPAANRGGLVATDEDSRVRLLRGACRLASNLGVAYLEIREQAGGAPGLDLRVVSDRHVVGEVPLNGGEAAVSSRIRKRTRKYARAAGKAGFCVEVGRDVDALHVVYSETMRRRGSPPFSRAFFSSILDSFGDLAEIAVVRRGPEVAAADLLLRDARTQYSLFAGSCAALHAHRPNDMLVHAELMRACALGLERFDLGRSPAGSSSLNFKRGWGGQVVPLSYSYFLHGRREPPSLDPDAFPWKAVGRVWSRLPDVIVDRLGPRLVKNLH